MDPQPPSEHPDVNPNAWREYNLSIFNLTQGQSQLQTPGQTPGQAPAQSSWLSNLNPFKGGKSRRRSRKSKRSKSRRTRR